MKTVKKLSFRDKLEFFLEDNATLCDSGAVAIYSTVSYITLNLITIGFVVYYAGKVILKTVENMDKYNAE